jgi:hypothetical protein
LTNPPNKRLKNKVWHIGGNLLLFLGFCYGELAAQANRSFAFIDLPSIAGQAALGGLNYTLSNDPLMFLENPALLDSTKAQYLAAHYQHFPGGLHIATLGYQWKGSGKWEFGAGLKYLNYGEFEGFDDTGFPMGTFHANEYALAGGVSRKEGVFSYGLNLKLLGSVLESYQAYAIVADIGILYTHPEEDLVVTLVAKQVGSVLTNYIEGQSLNLPSDVRIGLSYKAENMPMRFHASLRNLLEFGEEIPDFPTWHSNELSMGDRLFSRVVLGTEIIAHKQVHLRVGYNHLVRREFSGGGSQGLGGFTGGINIDAGKFSFSYSRMFFHVAGATNLFGVSSNLNQWRKF